MSSSTGELVMTKNYFVDRDDPINIYHKCNQKTHQKHTHKKHQFSYEHNDYAFFLNCPIGNNWLFAERNG